MLGPMVIGSVKLVAGVAVAAVVARIAYGIGGMSLVATGLGLLCIGVIAFRSLSASRQRADLLHDPAVSTLVFPPESKVRQAARPPR